MKTFQPFFTDSQKESPLSLDTPIIKANDTETKKQEYIIDYGDSFSEPAFVKQESAPIQKPTSGIDVGNMQDVVDALNKHNVKFKITSGKRTKPMGAAGNKSHHLSGNALDIAPIEGMSLEDFKNQFRKNIALLDFLKSKGYGILDETTPEMLSKTGGTGAHFHIGPDKIAREGLPSWYAKRGMKFPKFEPGGSVDEIKSSMTTQYRKGTKKLGKLSKEIDVFPTEGEKLSKKIVATLNTTPVSFTSGNILFDPNINGAYNQIDGSVIVRDDAKRSTIVHELAHASKPRLQKKRITQLKNMLGNHIYRHGNQRPSEYLDSEEEIYARLKAACDKLGIDLSKDYTNEEIEKILLKASNGKIHRYLMEDPNGKKSIKTISIDGEGKATSTPSPKGAKIIDMSTSQVFEDDYEFLNRYSDNFIKHLIKDLVSVDRSNPNEASI